MDVEWSWLCFEDLTVAQLYDAMVLRQEVFVLEQRCLFVDADGLDPVAWHGFGYARGVGLCGYGRILPPGRKFEQPSIGRVVTAPKLRGRGLGRALMHSTLAQTDRLYPGQALRIAAQAYLEEFYRSFGFRTVGPPYDEDGIKHVDMLRGTL